MTLDDASRLALAEAGLVELRSDVGDIKSDIKDMKTTLLGRPSWGVAMALTFLTSMCVGLAVALATLHG